MLIERRRFLTLVLLGGATLARSGAARAQHARMPTIGYLSSQAAHTDAGSVAAFRQGLKEAGFSEGHNLAMEHRFADGHYERLPSLATELAARPVALIMAASLPAALAAKAASSSIPIVFVSGADPVKMGLVQSLGRPEGNLTGVTQYFGALGAKRLEILRELVPAAAVIAVLSNPKNPNAEDHVRDIAAGARVVGCSIEVFRASSDEEIDAAIAAIAGSGLRALLVADDPLFSTQRVRLVQAVAKHAIPSSYYARSFVEAGGLLAYGSSSSDNYRQAGIYAARILKGDKPADLPVLQPTKFELVINMKTARALGLSVPLTLQAQADEVIE